MPRTFCLLNHDLTQKQLCELKDKFASQTVLFPQKELSLKWSQIDPEKSNEDIVLSVVCWLESYGAKKGDLFIVQGEFGATFKLVDYALKNELVPVYATTRRVAKESRCGEVVRREYVFEHVCFKRYGYFEEAL